MEHHKTFINKEELLIRIEKCEYVLLTFFYKLKIIWKTGDSHYKQWNWQICPPDHDHEDTDGQDSSKNIYKLSNAE